ncbi:MAG: hypothetical protein HY595_04160, partial [Candidatus Omnitrophica bacterium]|nr:hypothetical protein [Candidatus Omnitrophota bacterium]
MRRQPFLVIDISSKGIAWAIGQPTVQPKPSPFELLGWGTVDTETPQWDPAGLAHAIERVLKGVTLTSLPDRASVCLSHPALSHHRVTTQVDLADEPIMIRERDLERLRSLSVTQAMPIDHELLALEPLGYAGNGFSGVTDPRGLTATRVRGTFHLITVPLALRRALGQALESLGIELEGLTYRPKALVAGGVLGEGRQQRSLLVDGDGIVWDLALVDQGRIVEGTTLRWDVKDTEMGDTKQILDNWFVSPNCPPSRAVITGRIALVDGMVERLEQATGVSAVLGRSPWAQSLGDLSRQV